MEKVQLNEDYSEFEKVSLNTIKGFFTEKNLKSLVFNYDILTLKDLFEQVDNGMLYEKNQKMNYITEYQRNDFWLTVNGTVNVLKCKYFGKDLLVNENMNKNEYFKILGFSSHNGYKFSCANLNCLSQLLEIIKSNNFNPIYNMGFQDDENESIINRVKVVYNFLYGIKEEIDLEFISNDLDLNIQELYILLNNLKKRIEESRELDLEIENLKSKIEQQKEKVKILVK